MKPFAFTFCLAAVFAPQASAQYEVGTWQMRNNSPGMLMIVESAGSGVQITYKALGPDGKANDAFTMSVRTQLDGADAPFLVNGQPSGETLAIKRIDARHASSVAKFQGKQFGVSKSELSPDGKVLTVENDMSANTRGRPVGKTVEIWDRR